jgi:hypothetical protein
VSIDREAMTAAMTARCPICGRSNPPTTFNLKAEGVEVVFRGSYTCRGGTDGPDDACEVEYNIEVRGHAAADLIHRGLVGAENAKARKGRKT